MHTKLNSGSVLVQTIRTMLRQIQINEKRGVIRLQYGAIYPEF